MPRPTTEPVKEAVHCTLDKPPQSPVQTPNTVLVTLIIIVFSSVPQAVQPLQIHPGVSGISEPLRRHYVELLFS